MECPICYEDCKCATTLTLKCGHMIHAKCIKDWYIKSTTDEPGCPMCRSPIRFKGCLRTIPRWEEIKYETQEDPILEEFIEHIFDNMENDIESPRARNQWMIYLSDSMRLYNTMRDLEWEDFEIEDGLWSDFWLSPKAATKWERWWTDPKHVPEKPTKYPRLKKSRVHKVRNGRIQRCS